MGMPGTITSGGPVITPMPSPGTATANTATATGVASATGGGSQQSAAIGASQLTQITSQLEAVVAQVGQLVQTLMVRGGGPSSPMQCPMHQGIGGSAGADDTPAATDDPAKESGKDAAGTYTVQAGDTLSKIAQHLSKEAGRDISWQDLYAANADVIGSDPNLIKPGQQLKLPEPGQKASAPESTGEPITNAPTKPAGGKPETSGKPESSGKPPASDPPPADTDGGGADAAPPADEAPGSGTTTNPEILKPWRGVTGPGYYTWTSPDNMYHPAGKNTAGAFYLERDGNGGYRKANPPGSGTTTSPAVLAKWQGVSGPGYYTWTSPDNKYHPSSEGKPGAFYVERDGDSYRRR
jgi:LysM repeat protein